MRTSLYVQIAIAFFVFLLLWMPLPQAAAAAQTPNDPLYKEQRYLEQIHVPAAWEYIEAQGRPLEEVIVAVVDTGVDLKHPDLAGRLVQGANILRPAQPPQDDNGHGTAVAGIIAAQANNGIGIAGIAPNVKIMPIKAVGANGDGEEEHLGQGIQYAVDHGADIVVLSLGLHLYSPYLMEIVQEAEAKGVLLVAATGNSGESVMYPAAYPSVVAVGGATLTNMYKPESNFGPEVDLLAPWHVYTTNKGGGYSYKEGTSMAAPQVAAVAALMLGLNPELAPGDVRERLYQSAEPLASGWNPKSGYGLLRADRAVSMEMSADLYEPNDRKDQAKPISPVGIIRAELQSTGDIDWFSLEPPYPGEISIKAATLKGEPAAIELIFDPQDGGEIRTVDLSSGKAVRLPSRDGQRVLAGVRMKNQEGSAPLRYEIRTDFHIYQDAYEPNDRIYQAYRLPLREKLEVTGTFHKIDDQDWFRLEIDHPGTLLVRLGTDTKRIDPELLIVDADGMEHYYDKGMEGATEYSDEHSVEKGTYYLRVRNVKSLYPLPVAGEYQLTVEYTKRFFDANEPNNRSYQATTMVPGQIYRGVFDSAKDEDWFQIRLSTRSLVTIDIEGIPLDRYMYMNLYDGHTKETFSQTSPFGSETMRTVHDLEPGVYFIKLMTDAAFQYQQYGIRFESVPIASGFVDMEQHWARESVEKLTAKGIVKGYGNYRFEPNRTLTRAEAAAMIVRAYQLEEESSVASFPDVGETHWAKDAINAAALNGIIRGYPNGTFRPNDSVTRAEMAVMIAIASGMLRPAEPAKYFADVPRNHWAADYIYAFAAEGLIQGYADGMFRPSAAATRAEFAVILANVLK